METGPPADTNIPWVQARSAVTLVTQDAARAVHFYRGLGFVIRHAGERDSFTSLHAGAGYLNLIAKPGLHRGSWWDRVIFHVSDVDTSYARAVAAGLKTDTRPADAAWGERFSDMSTPDSHELSFAMPLSGAETARDGGSE